MGWSRNFSNDMLQLIIHDIIRHFILKLSISALDLIIVIILYIDLFFGCQSELCNIFFNEIISNISNKNVIISLGHLRTKTLTLSNGRTLSVITVEYREVPEATFFFSESL